MELVIGGIIAWLILLTFAEDGKFDDWQERRYVDRLADRNRKGHEKRSCYAKCG